MSRHPMGWAAWERQMWSQLLTWDEPIRISVITNTTEGRAEDMWVQDEQTGVIDWAGRDPVALERDRELIRQEERFGQIIRTEDPASSAWNPVFGLEPVLCRVCGNSSDPRHGKVLTHRSTHPCAPVQERPTENGHTSQVRDFVLLASAPLQEQEPGERFTLTPEETLELAVHSYRNPVSDSSQDVRECPRCLEISKSPGWPVVHTQTCKLMGQDGRLVCRLDPATVRVASVHLPGARSITDPDWHHLAGGWWVALPGTEPPAWAGHPGIRMPETFLSEVARIATRPTDQTPVRLTPSDRRSSSDVAAKLERMAAYFRALDRPETLHGVTALTQALASAVRPMWDALEGLHAEDEGALMHDALGLADCPVCPPQRDANTHTSGWPEQVLERMARTMHARMAADRINIPFRVVQVTLDFLIGAGARECHSSDEIYRKSLEVCEYVNNHFLMSPYPRDRGYGHVPVAWVAATLRQLRLYTDEGPAW